MKVNLVVLTPGKSEGKIIPIAVPEFVIGRDSQCHLRPASPIISKRHCAVVVRDGKVFVQDFGSTNGTFVNDAKVEKEKELSHDDRLTIGPLLFGIRIENSIPVDQPTPLPATRPVASANGSSPDEEAAALLLSLQDQEPAPGSPGTDGQGIPTGSTVLEVLSPAGTANGKPAETNSGPTKYEAAKQTQADTSIAAKAILDKYIRRPRG
jgi:pSer/pThr/pTyr-binding forkhead associated (FHA) protein